MTPHGIVTSVSDMKYIYYCFGCTEVSVVISSVCRLPLTFSRYRYRRLKFSGRYVDILQLVVWSIKCTALQIVSSVAVINSLRPRQMAAILADDIFKWIFLNENVIISIEISLKSVPKGPIDNIPALVQIMAWRRPGDKPLSGPMMVRLPTHICVTRPQWVKYDYHCFGCTKVSVVISSADCELCNRYQIRLPLFWIYQGPCCDFKCL